MVGSDPEIWRLLEVSGDLRLPELHEVIQIAVGWRQAHLHAFTDGSGRRWVDEESVEEDLGEDERSATLGAVLSEESGPLEYEYDFGDRWRHLVELIEIIPVQPEVPARPIRGERRAPLEDSGGIDGYQEKLAILAYPSHPDHDEIRDWPPLTIGPWDLAEFDPDRLDVERANRALRRSLASEDRAPLSGLPNEHDTPFVVRTMEEDSGYRARSRERTGQNRFAPDRSQTGWGGALRSLVERMYPGCRLEFGTYLKAADLDRPVLLDTESAAKAVRAYAWLMERVGTSGLNLSQAGWLPPVVVRDMMHDLGWESEWYGKQNRENHTGPVASLRERATRLGLLRKQHGHLVLTAAGRRLLETRPSCSPRNSRWDGLATPRRSPRTSRTGWRDWGGPDRPTPSRSTLTLSPTRWHPTGCS